MHKEHSNDFRIDYSIIAYKFILGVGELLLGFGILLFGNTIYKLYQLYTFQELFEDPHDIIASILQQYVPYLLQHRDYIIFVLILLGLVKIVGAIGLYYRKRWGLDVLVILTFLVLPFEFASILVHVSFMKLALFIFNLFIALYLVEFQPKEYFNEFKKRVRPSRSSG